MVQYQAFTKRFSHQLESLRGISAIVVLFTHCFQTFIAPFDQTIYPLIRLLGQSAVMMFFVLSGYLIGHSIQKNIHIFGRFNIWHYLKQRCKRVLPPFIFALALTATLYALAPYFFESGSRDFVVSFGIMIRSDYAVSLTDFLGSAFFLNGFVTPTISANAPLWSLSYEVWFYILAAFLPFILHHTKAFFLFIFFSILAVLSWLNIQFLIYFLIWLFACLLSYPKFRSSLEPVLDPLKKIFLILALCIACFDFYQFHYIYQGQEYTTENFTVFNLCIGLSFACWIIQLQLYENTFKALLPQTAHFSYTLYVTHFPLLLFIMGCFPQTLSYGFWYAFFSLIICMVFLIYVAFTAAKFLEPQRHINL